MKYMIAAMLFGWVLSAQAETNSVSTPTTSAPASKQLTYPSYESVEELLTVTQVHKTVQETFDAATSEFESQLATTIQETRQGQLMSDADLSISNEARNKLQLLLLREMSWGKIKTYVIGLYQQTYSQAEIDAMLAFYKSTGSALLTRLPAMQVLEKQMYNDYLKPEMTKIVSEAEAAIKAHHK